MAAKNLRVLVSGAGKLNGFHCSRILLCHDLNQKEHK